MLVKHCPYLSTKSKVGKRDQIKQRALSFASIMDDINAFFSFHFEITLPLGLWPFLHVFLSLLYMITKSVLCLHNCTMHISTGLLLVHIVVALEAKQGVPLLVVLSARLLLKKILPVGELNPGLPRDRRGYLPLY